MHARSSSGDSLKSKGAAFPKIKSLVNEEIFHTSILSKTQNIDMFPFKLYNEEIQKLIVNCKSTCRKYQEKGYAVLSKQKLVTNCHRSRNNY